MCLCLKIIDFIYFEFLNFEVLDSSRVHLQEKIANFICYWSDRGYSKIRQIRFYCDSGCPGCLHKFSGELILCVYTRLNLFL
jgi:uncharacterized protein (UPF0297 family)